MEPGNIPAIKYKPSHIKSIFKDKASDGTFTIRKKRGIATKLSFRKDALNKAMK